jgi:hypothetical protein
MSVREAVSAYQEGTLERRAFIRRLVAGGVSLGSAIAYAHLLAPDAKGAESSSDDFYEPHLDVAIDLQNGSLAGIRRDGLQVHVVVSDAAQVDLVAWRLERDGRTRLGSRTILFDRARGRVVKIPLTQQGRRLLEQADRARIMVASKATFAGGELARMRDTNLLS